MVRPDFLPVTLISISRDSGKAVFQTLVRRGHMHLLLVMKCPDFFDERAVETEAWRN
jgi:hypothetical protein